MAGGSPQCTARPAYQKMHRTIGNRPACINPPPGRTPKNQHPHTAAPWRTGPSCGMTPFPMVLIP